jgi:hypothetical protein
MEPFPNNPSNPEEASPQYCVEPVSVQEGRPFFGRVDWLSFGSTTLLTLSVYLLTLAPEVTLEMSGILSTAAMYGGVAHTPGFPLWSMYSWLFTKILPFSNVAWRVAVGCAVASSITCGLIALIVSRTGATLLEGITGFRRLNADREQWLRFVVGVIAGTTYGFNGVSWHTAVTVDTRAPAISLFSAVLCLLMRWSYMPSKKTHLYLAFFFFGLTVSASPMLMPAALALPFFVMCFDKGIGRDLFLAAAVLAGAIVFASSPGVFALIFDEPFSSTRIYLGIGTLSGVMCFILILKTRKCFTAWSPTITSGSLSLLGLLPFISLPIVSMTNPPSNWGYARTVEGFSYVLSRGQYERLHTTAHFDELIGQLGIYANVATKSLGIPCALTALVPFFFLIKMQAKPRGMILGLSAFFICMSVLMTVLMNPPPDAGARGLFEQYFAPSYVILAIWSGLGLVILGAIVTRGCCATEGRNIRKSFCPR